MNLCRYAYCPTPDVPLTLAKRRYHPDCALHVIRARWCDRDQSKPPRPYDNSRRRELDMDSPEAIAAVEKAYSEALAVIKRRTRPEPDLRWTSPLAGLNRSGL